MTILLEKKKLGAVNLKNRMIMAPMGLHSGNITKEVVEFYKARVDGQAAMLMCNIMVSDRFEDTSSTMVLTEENKSAFAELCSYAHEKDCRICAQLMPGCGRIGGPSKLYPVPVSASDCGWLHAPDVPCHELTKAEIGILLDEFRRSARLAIDAGADAIEIHAYGGYLTDQFLTKAWNRRTDEYGGSLEGRMKFLLEMVDIAKDEGGKDFTTIVKYTPSHYMPEMSGFRGMAEGIAIAKRLEKAGVDALHIDAGCHENWYLAMPPVYFQEMTFQIKSAKIIKDHVSLPVITHGRLSSPAKAEAAILQGACDFVAIGRGLLADPDLPKKIMEGRSDEIRPCISCNEGCIGEVCSGRTAGCVLNPFCGHETERSIEKTSAPRKILIVGAGPGGCMAALLAKYAGHEVEIWEKSLEFGGRARSAAMPYMKRDMMELIRYYQIMLAKEQIPVRYGKTADRDSVKDFAPDALIWAAGGKTLVPKSIKGIEGKNVWPAEDALRNLANLGQEIVIIGGGLVGVETAVDLARRGKDVTVVEMQDKLLPQPPFVMNATQLQLMLSRTSVVSMVNTRAISIESGKLKTEDPHGIVEIPCDTVLLAMGYIPSADEITELESICPVYAIGDSVQARNIGSAVEEAYEAVKKIG